MLVVVRHADAGDKRNWQGPDTLRPLSPAGHRQAEGLVIRLEDYPVERILSSPTVRCRQTVEPLACDRFLQVEPVEELGVDSGLAQTLAVFWDRGLQDAVLCTHGETIGTLLMHLAADGLVVEDPLHWPKGSAWLLQRTNGRRQLRGRFLAPLVLDGRVQTGWSAPDPSSRSQPSDRAIAR